MNFAKTLGTCAAVGAAGYFTYLIPQTVGLEKYRANITRYRLGKEVMLPQRIHRRLNEVFDDLKVPPEIRRKIKLFDVFGFDTYNCGLVSTKYGAILGVPANFSFKDVSQINKEDITVFDMPVDWTRDDAQEFLKNLVIPEQAQKAAMAHCVLRIQSNEPHYHALLAGLMAGNTCGFYHLVKGHVKNRKTCALMLAATAFAAWLYTKDYISRLTEKTCDEKMLQLDPYYVNGSKEYLDLIIKRNVAARSLLHEYGETVFTDKGDLKFWLKRAKTLPLTERREFYATKLGPTSQWA